MVLGRQGGESGEQRGGGVGGQVVHVGDAAGCGQFHRQQAEQVADRGDVAGAGVAGGGGECWQVQGEQVGQHQQQPGHPGGRGGGQSGVVISAQCSARIHRSVLGPWAVPPGADRRAEPPDVARSGAARPR